MKKNISKIIIDYNENNWFILTKSHEKYCGNKLLGIRKILESEKIEEVEEGLKIALEYIIQTIEYINNKKDDNKIRNKNI